MPSVSSSALLLTVAAGVACVGAQLRSTDALAIWYSSPGCAASASTTTVVSVAGFLQRVPGSVSFPFYTISCDPAFSGTGAIRFCASPDSCDLSSPFSPGASCLAVDPTLFGSSSVAVACPTSPDEAVVPGVGDSLGSDYVEVNYFEKPGCGSAGGDNVVDRSIVVVRGGEAQRVPNAPTLGFSYVVTCGLVPGVGLIAQLQFFATPDASGPADSVVYAGDEQCVPSDFALYGAGSYAVHCPPAPATTLPLLPFPAPTLGVAPRAPATPAPAAAASREPGAAGAAGSPSASPAPPAASRLPGAAGAAGSPSASPAAPPAAAGGGFVVAPPAAGAGAGAGASAAPSRVPGAVGAPGSASASAPAPVLGGASGAPSAPAAPASPAAPAPPAASRVPGAAGAVGSASASLAASRVPGASGAPGSASASAPATRSPGLGAPATATAAASLGATPASSGGPSGASATLAAALIVAAAIVGL